MTYIETMSAVTQAIASQVEHKSEYRNPWHRPGHPEYGPASYVTDARPVEYRGFMIYQRIKGHVWDVVRNGQCITQLAGPNGARQAIDAILAV